MTRVPPLEGAEFICPREDEATRYGEYFLSLGRDKKGRLLAIITKGHPNVSDQTEVCDITVVEDRECAAAWFGRALIEKPWEARN